MRRFAVPEPSFFANLQAKLTDAGTPWQPEDMPMLHLSLEEKRLMLGAEPPPDAASFDERERNASANFQRQGIKAVTGVPTAWDWRSYENGNYITDVRNQKTCGSCVAFGTISTVEGTTRVSKREPGLSIDLAEAHLFYCHAASEGRNCGNGWWPDRALDAFRDKGVVDEACFPYTPGDQACSPCGDWQNRLTKIKGWQSLQSSDQMKTWIAKNGPVVGCFVVYEDFMAYRSGIYRHISGQRLGGHCICIIGYSDADSCWIIKNSWGAGWGEQGFGRIAYGEVGIDYEMWGVEVSEIAPNGQKWLEKQLITGIWIIDQGLNAAIHIDGTGWKKIPSGNEALFQVMINTFVSAKATKSPCNIRLEGDFVKEVYVF
jgi:hypothetical protein